MNPVSDHPIILFDGVCNLCTASVHFIIKRDPRNRFRFCPLQSSTGQGLLVQYNLPQHEINTIVLIHGERCYTKSAAGLEIVRGLKGLWPLLYVFVIIPPCIRDRIYGFIAKNRYRWFGRKETCVMPSPEMRQRFLDSQQQITINQ
ncbi:MAG: DUF393 domain-containing protein [Kiritimatiellae bacterium]|nr:DUF393 domain-containing protein [Kiritimatiellia bacterium]